MLDTSLQRILRLFGSLAFLLQASHPQMSNSYIGCFQDRRHEWSFFWWPPGRSRFQTANSCNQQCSSQRFSYFGMGGAFGTDCHCGNGGFDINPPSGECTTCNSFSGVFGCGAKAGENRILSVYMTQGTQSRIDDRFVGCWSATEPTKVLDLNPVTIVEDDLNLSLETCLRRCWKNGNIYAGIMFGRNCYCGNDLQWEGENRTPASTSSCDTICDGAVANVCGGQSGSLISIYRAAPTEAYWGTYVGCFTDLQHDWMFFWWPDAAISRFHPLSSCYVTCQEQGFLYFGLGGRYGTECYCDNGNFGIYGPSAECKECSTRGETFSCGARFGAFRLLAVYKIPNQKLVDPRYVGCWTADNPIYVLGDQPVEANKDSGMTVIKCINECVKLGRTRAGIMRGSMCYCGSSLKWIGTNKRPVASAQCNTNCPGGSDACGGSSSVISIYRAECPNGTYAAVGRGCSPCNCNRGAPCDPRSGECPGECIPGWTRAEGKGPCLNSCPEGTYGIDCKFVCHCYADVRCNKQNGQCPGPCAPGWTISFGDIACSQKISGPQKQTEDETEKVDIVPIAAGAGAGGFLLLLIIIITVCCCRKKRKAAQKRQEEEEAAARKLEEARRKRERRRRQS